MPASEKNKQSPLERVALVVGILAALIAVFAFLTGYTNLPALFTRSSAQTPALATGPATSASPNNTAGVQQYPDCLIAGEWEAQDPNNKFRILIKWDQTSAEYMGVLSQQGTGSQAVGFAVGELVFKAKPAVKSGVLDEQSKWHFGSGGVSTGSEWRANSVDVNAWASTDDGVFYNGTTFARASNASIPTCQRP